MNTSIAKKIAVVSGGTGYVGSAIASQLAKDGMSVAILYNSSKESEVKELLTKLGNNPHKAYKCDLRNYNEIESTINIIEKEMGPLYACVHAAGIRPKRKQLYLSSIEDLKEQFEGNALIGFNFISACAKRLKENKEGIIIGITTIGVLLKEEAQSLGAYIPAKYALQGMLVMFKEELSKYGIRVYSVAPGFMEEGMNNDIPKSFVEIIKEKSPNKEITTAKDVALMISKLCSDTSHTNKELNIPITPNHK